MYCRTDVIFVSCSTLQFCLFSSCAHCGQCCQVLCAIVEFVISLNHVKCVYTGRTFPSFCSICVRETVGTMSQGRRQDIHSEVTRKRQVWGEVELQARILCHYLLVNSKQIKSECRGDSFTYSEGTALHYEIASSL